jgi:hypothetical protein
VRWIALILPALAVGAAGSGCYCVPCGYPPCAPMQCCYRPQFCGTCAPYCPPQFAGVPLAYNYGAPQFCGDQPYQPALAQQPPAQSQCADCCCEGEWHEYKLIPVDRRGVALNVSLADADTISLKGPPGQPCAVRKDGKEFCPPASGSVIANRPTSSVLEGRVKNLEDDVRKLQASQTSTQGKIQELGTQIGGVRKLILERLPERK